MPDILALAHQQPHTNLLTHHKISDSGQFTVAMANMALSSCISRRTRSLSCDTSSTTSSLTHENLRKHIILRSHDPKSQNELDVDIDVEAPSSSSSTCSSARELDTPNDVSVNQTPFPAAQQDSASTDIDASPRPQHVHFRPRVRITSGISRHRHKQSPPYSTPDPNFVPFSPDSSISSSPSSSISVPLHSPSDDEADKPGWGPLGQRVSLLAREGGRRRTSDRRRKRRYTNNNVSPCERTPLLGPSMKLKFPPKHHNDHDGPQADEMSESDRQRSRVGREIDEAFGPMPVRLLNLHWWLWRLEPVVCCCLDESDFE